MSYSDASPFTGSEFIVAHEHNLIDLRDPAAAYNSDDNQYLIVFKRGSNAVHGQMLSAHSSSPTPLYPTYGFSIRLYVDGSDVNYPHVAWGGDSGTFLVVWQNIKNFIEDGTIQAKYLFDTYQGGGSQFDGSEIKVAPFAGGDDPLSNDCTYPAAAYDPYHQKYVVLFAHREGVGLYVPLTVHAQRVKGIHVPASRSGTAFPVETDISEEDVHYRDIDLHYSGMDDTMYVVYIKSISSPDPHKPRYASVYTRTINGANVSGALFIRAAELGVDKHNSNLATTRDGRALVVWSDEVDVGSTDTDVVAVRLAPNRVYLPCIFGDN